ncbi:Tigger transposable element-derived protein 4 [Trichinella pseudospiralis]|uniref:Tigger transposable element-derived protein 4 n=1 Tax=Trichinella pseudospiralis TaxID=6337 RepID=A0A0V1FFJ5_TRIPS|nr:Tigger transposable element-derived protein 4 [Trichinella pseudospiralis]
MMSQPTKRVPPSRKLKALNIGLKTKLPDALMSKKKTRKEMDTQYGPAIKYLNASKQRFRKTKFDMMDRAVDVYFMQMRSKSAVITGPMNWKNRMVENGLPILLRCYEAKNIFSVDESGLFYKALPNHTLAVKDSSVCVGQTVKDHWTVMFFCNMDSTEKHVYVIGKSRKPRCICDKELPLPYYSNIKSWNLH